MEVVTRRAMGSIDQNIQYIAKIVMTIHLSYGVGEGLVERMVWYGA